jgi:hypothetical protein
MLRGWLSCYGRVTAYGHSTYLGKSIDRALRGNGGNAAGDQGPPRKSTCSDAASLEAS